MFTERLGRGLPRFFGQPASRGFTLIEVTLSLVIISIAAAGVMLLFEGTAKSSAEMLLEKQAYAVAEGLLAEITAAPFTYCDPNDPRVTTATGAFVGGTGCTATVEGLGPELGETRYAIANPFNNVNDYNGFVMGPGVRDVTGALMGGAGLGAYTATVTTTPIAFGGIGALDANGAAQVLQVTVTVTANNIQAVAEAIRTRYAPKSP
jgi:MSHA pilin protein MshD